MAETKLKSTEQAVTIPVPQEAGTLPDFNAINKDRAGNALVNGPYYYEQVITPWLVIGKGSLAGSTYPNDGSGQSVQLAPFTSTAPSATRAGYGNGCMLAYAKGDGTNGLTKGQLVNFDPGSADTGQKVWNGMIIADQALYQYCGDGNTLQSVKIATKYSNWSFYTNFLYCSGNPTTDGTLVSTALTASGIQLLTRYLNGNAVTYFNY